MGRKINIWEVVKSPVQSSLPCGVDFTMNGVIGNIIILLLVAFLTYSFLLIKQPESINSLRRTFGEGMTQFLSQMTLLDALLGNNKPITSTTLLNLALKQMNDANYRSSSMLFNEMQMVRWGRGEDEGWRRRTAETAEAIDSKNIKSTSYVTNNPSHARFARALPLSPHLPFRPYKRCPQNNSTRPIKRSQRTISPQP